MVEAALGHRAVVLTLTNHGEVTRTITGYPEVRVLDGNGRALDVLVKRDSSYMARDPGPKPVTLAPGGHLLAVVSWSNTVTDGDPSTGAAIAVAVAPGEPPRTLPVRTDLGTTGEVTVNAWAAELLH
ncbi:DUF4232 domain-containing protein [Amycolatopsis samaneae]